MPDPKNPESRISLECCPLCRANGEYVERKDQNQASHLGRGDPLHFCLLQSCWFMLPDSPFPKNLMLSIAHCVLVKGELTNFELRTPTDVEATELYPNLKYTTVDDILGKLA
ncbi:hypothetical protein Droror1_Dr00001047 [Drosera rotundifolia]